MPISINPKKIYFYIHVAFYLLFLAFGGVFMPLARAYSLNPPQSPTDRIYVVQEVVEDSSTSAEILEALVRHRIQNSELAWIDIIIPPFIAKHPHTSVDVLRTLWESDIAYWGNTLAKDMAMNPNTPEDILMKIADSRSADEFILARLAENPNVPEPLRKGMLKKLSVSGNVSIRRRAAANPLTEKDVLQTLSHEEDIGVALGVAKNPGTPDSVLRALSHDKNSNIVFAVATNPNTPADILTTLSATQHFHRAIAANPSVPRNIRENIFRGLATGGDASERSFVAEQRGLPKDVINILTKDEEPLVRSLIASNVDIPVERVEALSKDTDPFVRRGVMGRRDVKKQILRHASGDEDVYVRAAVAENPNTPEDILEKLSKDTDHRIRKRVAANPNTPEHILKTFLKNEDTFISVYALITTNPSVSPGIRHSALRKLLYGNGWKWEEEKRGIEESETIVQKTPIRLILFILILITFLYLLARFFYRRFKSDL